MLRFLGGDIERQPGPSRTISPIAPTIDLMLVDVTAATAKRYEKSVRLFEVWLWSAFGATLNQVLDESLSHVLRVAGQYIRSEYRAQHIFTNEVSTFCAALKTYLSLCQHLGMFGGMDIPAHMRVLWRLRRNFTLEMPSEFRIFSPAAIWLKPFWLKVKVALP